MIKKAMLLIKLYIQKSNLNITQESITDIENWLESVTVKDRVYLIINAKEELTELRRDRLQFGYKVKQLEKQIKRLSN